MILCFDDKDDIPRLSIRSLICFPSKSNTLTLLHSLVNMNIQYLAFIYNLFPITFLTLVLGRDDFSLSITIWTQSLKSLNHRSHLTHNNLLSAAIATFTSLDRSFLAASSSTFRTKNCLLQSKFTHFSLV